MPGWSQAERTPFTKEFFDPCHSYLNRGVSPADEYRLQHQISIERGAEDGKVGANYLDGAPPPCIQFDDIKYASDNDNKVFEIDLLTFPL